MDIQACIYSEVRRFTEYLKRKEKRDSEGKLLKWTKPNW